MSPETPLRDPEVRVRQPEQAPQAPFGDVEIAARIAKNVETESQRLKALAMFTELPSRHERTSGVEL